MLNSFWIRSRGLAAAIVALTMCGVARADDLSATRHVSTHGLDLSTTADQAKLRKQINTAARQVCAEVTDGMNPGDADFQDCVQGAFAGAWAQVETRIASAKSHSMIATAAPK